MTLIEFAETVYWPSRLELKRASFETLLVPLRLLDQWRKQPTETTELTVELLTGFLRHLTDNGLAARSVNSYRSSLLTIWRAAARKPYYAPPLIDPEEVPKRRPPKLVPKAWTIEELERLLEQCGKLTGFMRNCPAVRRADYWTSLILFLYDSGARIGAALSVEMAHVDLTTRHVLLMASTAKTNVEQLIGISPQTAMALRRVIDRRRTNVWPCGRWRHELYRQLKKLLADAGLPTDRKSKFHRLRKTNSSHTAANGSIEMAQRQLGHTSARMTWDSYLDPRIVCARQSVDVLPRPTLRAAN